MFDKLVDLLVQFIGLFYVCEIVEPYQSGVRVTLGKPGAIVNPGLRFHWPFRIGHILVENVVLETKRVGPQSLTTLPDEAHPDGVEVVIGTVVSFKIFDVKAFLLEVEGRNQFIEDITYGTTAKFVMSRTWKQLAEVDIAHELTKTLRADAKKYGVEVVRVQLADFTRDCKSIRLVGPPPIKVDLLH